MNLHVTVPHMKTMPPVVEAWGLDSQHSESLEPLEGFKGCWCQAEPTSCCPWYMACTTPMPDNWLPLLLWVPATTTKPCCRAFEVGGLPIACAGPIQGDHQVHCRRSISFRCAALLAAMG